MSAQRGSRKRSLADKRRLARTVASSAVLLMVVAVLGGGVYALHLPSVRLTEVTVAPAQYVDTGALQKLVEAKLAGSYAFIIPHSSIFLYPHAAIVKAIMSTYSSVESASVIKSGTTLTVTVVERAPVARWCTDTGCYFMDANGRVFAPATTAVGVRYSGAIKDNPVGQVFLTGKYPALATTVQTLSDKIGAVSAVAVTSDDDVFVTLVQGGVVRFSRGAMSPTLMARIVTTFQLKEFTQGKSLEYADFRFGDKVYVKWK